MNIIDVNATIQPMQAYLEGLGYEITAAPYIMKASAESPELRGRTWCTPHETGLYFSIMELTKIPIPDFTHNGYTWKYSHSTDGEWDDDRSWDPSIHFTIWKDGKMIDF